MAILTLGTIVLMPLILPWEVGGMDVDPWSIARPLLILIVLPMGVGMMINSLAARWAALSAPVFLKIGSASLILLFVVLIFGNFKSLLRVMGSGAIAVSIVYVLGLFICGWLLGGPEVGTRGVLGLTTAARNFGAAMVPASGSLPDPNVNVMIIVNAIVGLVMTFLIAMWIRRKTALI
jgi:BASS family bile acid:Na+ symporter